MVLTIVESSFWSPWRGKTVSLYQRRKSPVRPDWKQKRSLHLADNRSPGNASIP